MKPFFLLLAFLFVAAALLLRLCSAGKDRWLSVPDRLNVWIIVKNQESWIEGFIRKLFRVVKDSAGLQVNILDDCSRDRTAEILHRLGRIYPIQVHSAGEGGGGNNCDAAAGSGPAAALRFDVRPLKGRELLNAPLFCHLSRLNEGKSQVLSK